MCQIKSRKGRTRHTSSYTSPARHTHTTETVTDRALRQLVLERRRQRRVPLARVDVQNLPARGRVGEREAELAVEAAWPAEGGVHGVGPVGGACGGLWW